MKVTEDDRGDFLVKLKLVEGKFKILKYEEIGNVEEVKKDFTERYGVKCVLRKKRRFFDFEDVMININLIEDVGEFLIVEGEGIGRSYIEDKIKIQNPEFIAESFDELKLQREGRERRER